MPANTPQPSAAVLAARGRRAKAGRASDVRFEWFIKEVSNKVAMTMKARVKLATELVRNKVVKNIGRPVTKGTGPRGGKVVTDRSKDGEYLKAETTQLMKTVFSDVRMSSKGVWDGFVGTPLDYGLIWELRNLATGGGGGRKFLTATLKEEEPKVKKILSGPIR
jgi:hypothetical protein